MSARARSVAVAVALVWVAAACSSGSRSLTARHLSPMPTKSGFAYVALGGDETVNRQLDDPFRDAWPQPVFTNALPRSAVYVNFARPEATAADALSEQVPAALDLEPTVATVWLGAGDARIGTSDASFTRDLSDVVAQLQGAGAACSCSPSDRVTLTRSSSPTPSRGWPIRRARCWSSCPTATPGFPPLRRRSPMPLRLAWHRRVERP